MRPVLARLMTWCSNHHSTTSQLLQQWTDTGKVGVCRTAKDVQMLDAVLADDFTVVDGSLEVSLGKIEAGSSVQHSYVIVPTKGSFGLRFPPATVSYVAELDSTERQASTPRAGMAAAHVSRADGASGGMSAAGSRTIRGADP